MTVVPLHDPRDHEGQRDLPVNYEAEQALLGAILARNDIYDEVVGFLRSEHFAEEVHGRIYAAIGTLIDRNEPANSVTLKQAFEHDDALKDVGGAKYIEELQRNYVSLLHGEHYARLVHDCALKRAIVDLCEDQALAACDGDLEVSAEAQIEDMESKLQRLVEGGESGPGAQPAGLVALQEALPEIEAAWRHDGTVSGLATFQDLDSLTGGLQKSDLVVLAGRPSMGKTAVALAMAHRAALAGSAVAVYTLEMSAKQLAMRLLTERTGISTHDLRQGRVGGADGFDRIAKAARDLEDIKLFFDGDPNLTVSKLRSRARRLKRQHDLGLIVVDYLQLLRPAGASRPDYRVQEVSEMTRGLKALAKELDVPVLLLSQLNRALESREDKRPLLSDLRESGSIEQDADVVIFVFRESYYLERSEPRQRANQKGEAFDTLYNRWSALMAKNKNVVELFVAKHRSGPIGNVRLYFDEATMKVEDLARSGEREEML